MKKNILFVCTGNTCRSPMAEALFKNLLEEREDLRSKLSASSAGVYAFEGDPASHEAVSVMKNEFGINLSSHRARILTDQDIKQAYLILTMTRHHREMILDIYPEAADKVFTLRGFIGEDEGSPDISDPFGYDYEVYKECAYEIEACLMDILDKIL